MQATTHTTKNRFLARALTAALLAAATSLAVAEPAARNWELSEHQKGIPGPVKLRMTEADYSGQVINDPGFIADRLAILNHVSAYSYLIDEGRWDHWFALFSDDVLFESTVPCFGTVSTRGKQAFEATIGLRYRTSKTTAMRRHTMGNIHVAAQTPTTAEVRAYMLISAVPAADQLKTLTTGTYNATLEKRNSAWTITRWYIEVDAPVAQSPMPEGLPADVISYLPDNRAECARS